MPIDEKVSVDYKKERFRIIFEYSPIAIWEEDFSALADLKKKIDKEKVTNIRDYLVKHPDLVKETFRKLKIIDVNQAALQLYGAKNKAQLLYHLGQKFHKSTLTILCEEFSALLSGQTSFETEYKSRTITGKAYDVRIKVSVPEIYKTTFERVIVTLQDVSVQKRYEKHLKRLAQTDGLTDVLNHNAITYRLEDEFRRGRRYHLNLSCMMIDLDDFKKINDTYGHQKGDLVIKKTAHMIKTHLREVDVVGRYGGDEFFVILPETTKENAMNAAQRIRTLFDQLANDKSNRVPFCTVSVGVGGLPADQVENASDLIKCIDKAMYEAKKKGRNVVCST